MFYSCRELCACVSAAANEPEIADAPTFCIGSSSSIVCVQTSIAVSSESECMLVQQQQQQLHNAVWPSAHNCLAGLNYIAPWRTLCVCLSVCLYIYIPTVHYIVCSSYSYYSFRPHFQRRQRTVQYIKAWQQQRNLIFDIQHNAPVNIYMRLIFVLLLLNT